MPLPLLGAAPWLLKLTPFWGFIKRNWEWFLIGAAAIFLFFWVKGWINDIKEEAYNEGVVAERAYWENAVDQEDAKNRAIEATIQNAMTNFTNQFVDAAAERVSQEAEIQGSVRETVREVPVFQQCEAPQEVVDGINSLINLGPPVGEGR